MVIGWTPAAIARREHFFPSESSKIDAMVSFLSIIAIGFFLGMRHATDPDHVVAVTTIVTRQRQLTRAALTGAFWGLGHTVTILVVGALIILFNVVIPTRIGLSMEFSVALMLIVLGVMNVVAFMRTSSAIAADAVADEMTSEAAVDNEVAGDRVQHSHAHSHGDFVHRHSHSHADGAHTHHSRSKTLVMMDRVFGKLALYRPIRPFIVGVVHGLAGSAAVALLVLTQIRDPKWAVAYLLVFGIGTVGGMMLITLSMASAFQFLGKGQKRFSQRLALASGLLSLAFGMLLVYQIGFAGGLFTSHPHWTPH